jgi:bifunctional non-homologous end joining protein LigD
VWLLLGAGRLVIHEFRPGASTHRKYFGAPLVGFFEGQKLKSAGRVGTGFSEKLLSSLYSALSKLRIEKCPFYNLPAAGGSRWDQGLSPAEMKRCDWVKPVMVCQVKFTEWTRDDRLRISVDASVM